MTTIEKNRLVEAIKRARELLADPSRVVLNPQHYAETAGGGREIHLVDIDEARERRDNCRVCFMGACGLAAYESLLDRPLESGEGSYPEDVALRISNHAEELLTEKIRELEIPIDPETAERWGGVHPRCGGDETVLMTSALVAGRAVEVCDAVLADLENER